VVDEQVLEAGVPNWRVVISMIIDRIERSESSPRCTYPHLLYVNEMAAALGELELQASLITHVLPSVASMSRIA